MSKFAEKITILLTAADGLFARLHRTEVLFSNPKTRPAFMDDKAFARVADAFEKAFPKLPQDPAKVAGYAATIQNSGPALFEMLAPHYYVFVDTEEWCRTAKEVLLEIGKGSTAIKYEANTLLTEGFLDLVQVYIRLHFMMQKVTSRNVVLPTFCRAYFHVKFTLEPSFDRVAAFVAEASEIIAKVQYDFRPIVNMIVDAIMSLQMPFLQCLDTSSLRNKGVHSLTLKPELMTQPSEEPLLYDMIHLERMHMRIAYGLLPCAEAYARVNPDLIGTVLRECVYTPLYRDLSVDLMYRYNIMLKNFKPKKGDIPADMAKELSRKLKDVQKVVSDAEKAVEHGEILGAHATRRVYLRQEMGSLHSLFSDKPGLLGPKLTLVLSLLAYARSELMWLMRHQCTMMPKGFKLKDEDFTDRHVTDLIYLINQLTDLVRKHAPLIRDYFQGFLSGADVRVAQREAAGLKLPDGSKARSLVDAVLAEAGALRPGAPANLDALRLNWFRVESYLSSTESAQMVEPLRVQLQKFCTIVRHSLYVDRIDSVFDDYVALDDLWYFREGFKQAFLSSTAGGATQPMRCMVYLRLLAEFANRPNEYCPDEHQARGKSCVVLARNFLERIALCINNGLVTMAHQFAQYEEQLTEVNAAYPLLKEWPLWKPAKDFVPPTLPGSESRYANRRNVDQLGHTEATVFQLCSALNEDITIQIYDNVFTPREFVRERLAMTLREFMLKKAIVSDGVIERPLLLERRINNFCSVFKLVENYLDINLSAMFRDVFLSQVYQPVATELGSPAPLGSSAAVADWEDVMVKPLVAYYVSFVVHQLMGADRGAVVWSPARNAFVSRTGNPYRAEEYASLVEMRALCRLIGPFGVKLLDTEVLKLVAGVTRKLKECLVENRAACVDLHKTLQERDSDALQKLKGFTNLDTVVTLMTNIGMALHFRQLVHDALGHVMRETVPFLYNAVECAFLQYGTNTFISEEFLACDLLAAECGVAVGTADQALKLALKDALGTSAEDVQTWSLLPTLCAASFLCKSWLEADYRTAVEGYRTNQHCIAEALSALVVCFKALTSQSRNEAEITLLLELFLEQSSVLLLRGSLMDPKLLTKLVPAQAYNWSDAVVFLDMFVEHAPFLQRESLERIMPYALVRSMYHQVYLPKEDLRGRTSTMRGAPKVQVASDGI